MPTAQLRFLETVPHALRDISETVGSVRPRLVLVQKYGDNEVWVNPASVAVVNAHDGSVKIGLSTGFSMATDFKTAENAVKALGLA